MKTFELCNIKFTKIIHKTSGYGVIFSGIYKNTHKCAIKMVILTTGIHYDKDNKNYIGNVNILNRNDKVPFYNKLFLCKRAVSEKNFKKELHNQILLNKFCPKVYDYGKINHNNIHYGFIVMDLLDLNLREYIIINKYLKKKEYNNLKELIDKFHEKYYHDDLKPANIGVKNGKFYILDCLTVGKLKYNATDNIDDNKINNDNNRLFKYIKAL